MDKIWSEQKWLDEIDMMSSALEFYNSLLLAQIQCESELLDQSEFSPEMLQGKAQEINPLMTDLSSWFNK